MTKSICKICKKEFKNCKSITAHIVKNHKITSKEYYDIFLKRTGEDVCEICNNKTNYSNLLFGYNNCCSRTCANKTKDKRLASSISSKNLWNDENSSFNSIIRSNKLRLSLKKLWNDENSIFRTNEYKNKKSQTIKKLHNDPNSGYNKLSCRQKRSKIMIKLNNDPYSSYNTLKCRNKRSSSVKLSYINNPQLLEDKKNILMQVRYNNRFKRISKPQLTLYKLCCNILPYPILEYPCKGKSIDIAAPKLSLAIEYDGPYWHKNKKEDLKRQRILEKEGWVFIRYSKIPDINKLIKDINEVLFNE